MRQAVIISAKILPLIFLLAVLAACESGAPGTDLEENLHEKILNGSQADPTLIPQVLSIVSEYFDGSTSHCTGTVVGPYEILTAGHCLGSGLLKMEALGYGFSYSIKAAILHPGYFADFDAGAIFNDIAILKTENRIAIPPLPVLLSRGIDEDEELLIHGTGVDESGSVGSLRTGKIIVATVTVNHIFASEYNDTVSNACHGDSGGPAIKQDGGVTEGIVGVTSTGSNSDCSPGDVTLYANLQNPVIFDFLLAQVPELLIR